MQHVDLGLRGNALETMQTGNVEAELDEVVGLTPDHERAAGRGDQTDSAAGILGLQELRSITEEQRRIAHALGLDDIDRRLKLAPGAGLVLTPEIAPLVRTRDPRVGPRGCPRGRRIVRDGISAHPGRNQAQRQRDETPSSGRGGILRATRVLRAGV